MPAPPPGQTVALLRTALALGYLTPLNVSTTLGCSFNAADRLIRSHATRPRALLLRARPTLYSLETGMLGWRATLTSEGLTAAIALGLCTDEDAAALAVQIAEGRHQAKDDKRHLAHQSRVATFLSYVLRSERDSADSLTLSSIRSGSEPLGEADLRSVIGRGSPDLAATLRAAPFNPARVPVVPDALFWMRHEGPDGASTLQLTLLVVVEDDPLAPATFATALQSTLAAAAYGARQARLVNREAGGTATGHVRVLVWTGDVEVERNFHALVPPAPDLAEIVTAHGGILPLASPKVNPKARLPALLGERAALFNSPIWARLGSGVRTTAVVELPPATTAPLAVPNGPASISHSIDLREAIEGAMSAGG